MKKRILFICFKHYNGILDGGGLANQRCYRMLQCVFGEENVDSLYVHDEQEKTSYWRLLQSAYYFLFNYHNGVTPAFVQKVVGMSKDYDYVFLSTSLFGQIAKELKKHGYGGTIITHFHNVESIYYDASVPKWLPCRSIIIRCADHNDGFSCRHSDKILVLNDRDKHILKEKYGRNADVVLPISLRDSFSFVDKAVMTSSCPLCIFIGSYFAPNNEGVLWFVRNVLPHVNIRFKVIGKNMFKLKEAYECMKDIEFVSDAPDLRPYFEEADFIVLPIFSGSGMKVKTCEALMYGKNILGTNEAFEGYDVNVERVGGCCNTTEDFIKRIQYYAENPVPRFNEYSRQIYLEKYSEEATYVIFRELLMADL